MKKEDMDEVCRRLVDRGLIVEAGFVGLRMSTIPADAPQVQIDEMRTAFFAGAQHLFGSIMSILDPGTEATQKDLDRLTLINDELDRFLVEFKRKHQ